MSLRIIRHDITKIKCDAIVNPTDEIYSHSGGTDEAIHRAAGEELYRECLLKGELSVGDATLTKAYRLPCKYVIHTVGPVWINGHCREEELLRSCYMRVLEIAKENGVRTLAIPLISSGTYGYPKDRVLKVAMDVISEFLFENEMFVCIVVYDKNSYDISRRLFADVSSYIDKNLESADEREEAAEIRAFGIPASPIEWCEASASEQRRSADKEASKGEVVYACRGSYAKNLTDMLDHMDKGFAGTLFSYIDAKGMTDVECYKRANVDRKVFSKIKCNPKYNPSKATAVSFAIALRLDLEETQELLKTAGWALSNSNKFDVIVSYFILSKNYDINEINETLFKFDQTLLGC